jgi:hypothetical protein
MRTLPVRYFKEECDAQRIYKSLFTKNIAVCVCGMHNDCNENCFAYRSTVCDLFNRFWFEEVIVG